LCHHWDHSIRPAGRAWDRPRPRPQAPSRSGPSRPSSCADCRGAPASAQSQTAQHRSRSPPVGRRREVGSRVTGHTLSHTRTACAGRGPGSIHSRGTAVQQASGFSSLVRSHGCKPFHSFLCRFCTPGRSSTSTTLHSRHTTPYCIYTIQFTESERETSDQTFIQYGHRHSVVQRCPLCVSSVSCLCTNTCTWIRIRSRAPRARRSETLKRAYITLDVVSRRQMLETVMHQPSSIVVTPPVAIAVAPVAVAVAIAVAIAIAPVAVAAAVAASIAPVAVAVAVAV
jgi:hypothetical protein